MVLITLITQKLISRSMSLDSKMGRRLSLFCSLGTAIQVELKSAKHDKFTAKVQDFITHGEDDTKVVFARVDGTVFPTDTGFEKADTYVAYIKNVKEIESV
jgi:hypothetical protein